MIGFNRIKKMVVLFNGGVKRRKESISVQCDDIIFKLITRMYEDGYFKKILFGKSDDGSITSRIYVRYKNSRGNQLYLRYGRKSGKKNYYSYSDLKKLNAFELRYMVFTTSEGIYFGDDLFFGRNGIGGELIFQVVYV